MSLPLAFLDLLGLQWFLLLALLGVLLYGERLPEVAAKFGRQLMELKKAAQSVRNEIESVTNDAKFSVASRVEKSERSEASSYEESTAPKFEPPPSDASVAVASGASANEPR